MLQNLSDLDFGLSMSLDFDLSRSLNVKCFNVIGLPIYGFPLLFNSNTLPILAHLRDIGFHSLSGLEIGLSRSLRSNGIILLDSQHTVTYSCQKVTFHSFTTYKPSKSE